MLNSSVSQSFGVYKVIEYSEMRFFNQNITFPLLITKYNKSKQIQ